jgi:hypothetical protein
MCGPQRARQQQPYVSFLSLSAVRPNIRPLGNLRATAFRAAGISVATTKGRASNPATLLARIAAIGSAADLADGIAGNISAAGYVS